MPNSVVWSFALANRLSMRLKQTEKLLAIMGVALEDPSLRLRNYPANQGHRPLELSLCLANDLVRPLVDRDSHSAYKLGDHSLGVAHSGAWRCR